MKKPTRQMRDPLKEYMDCVNMPTSILKAPEDKSSSTGPTQHAITQTFQWPKGSSVLHQQKTAIAFLEKALQQIDDNFGMKYYYWVLEFTKNMDIHAHMYITTTRSHNYLGLSVHDYYKLNMRVGYSLYKETFDVPGWLQYLEKDLARTQAALQAVHDQFSKQKDKYKGYKHLRGKFHGDFRRTQAEIDFEKIAYALIYREHEQAETPAPEVERKIRDLDE